MTAQGDGRSPSAPRGDVTTVAVRDAHLQQIVTTLRRLGSASRSQLHLETGLSRRTVGLLAESLITAGIVMEQPARHERARRGRPEVPLALRPGGRLVIGVHIRPWGVTCSAIDLAGTVIAASEERDHAADGDEPTAVVARAVAMAGALQARVGPDRVRMIGVSIGGVVDRSTGRVVDNPGRDWRDVDLGGPFARSGTEVVLGSSADALALDQHLGDTVPDEGLVLTVFVSGLVDVAITRDGRLLHGASPAPGTAAHFPVADGPGIDCWCGRKDCLGVVGGARVLHRRAVEAGVIGPERSWNVVETARADDPTALVELRRERARLIGESVGALIELLTPRRTVLRGWMGGTVATDHCLAVARQRCRRTLGAEPAIDYQDSTHATWDRASAALALDAYLHELTRYEPALPRGVRSGG